MSSRPTNASGGASANTVEEISPTGKLAEYAADPAVEDLQRIAELKDIETETMLIDKYYENAEKQGQNFSYLDALKAVQANRGRAREININTTGSGRSLAGVDDH